MLHPMMEVNQRVYKLANMDKTGRLIEIYTVSIMNCVSTLVIFNICSFSQTVPPSTLGHALSLWSCHITIVPEQTTPQKAVKG